MQQRSYIKHNKQRTTDKLLYTLPAIALLTIAGLGIAKYTVTNTDNANATYTPAMGNVVTAGVLSDMSLGVTIDDDSTKILRIIPDANGVFNQGDINITVNTSDIFGYTLNMYAYTPNTTTATTSLTNVSATLSGGTHPEIATLASGSSYTAEEFRTSEATKNKWGYKLGDNDKFIPVSSTTIINSNGEYGSHKEKVTIGAKIDNSIPNGLYEVTLNFVALAKAPTDNNENANFETAFAYAGVTPYGTTGHYAMQDMTDTICGYVYTPGTDEAGIAKTKSIQLVDKRDNNLYWVSKLADGKCWMTQNLDFDITGPLTSDTTNLTTSEGAIYTDGYSLGDNGIITWTPTRNTYKVVDAQGNLTTGENGDIGTGADKWINDDFSPYSVDAGKWYMNGTRFESSECNDVSASVGCNFLDKAKDKATSSENLSNYFAKTPYENNGEHGAVGNWYNWSAAVASNDTMGAETGAGTKQANSICPKGWTLPYTKDESTTASNEPGTYGNLNRLYNNSLSNSDEGLFNSPFYGVRGGNLSTVSDLSTLYDAGRLGFYWSGTGAAASTAYYLYFSSDVVSTAYADTRDYGFSVRCVSL